MLTQEPTKELIKEWKDIYKKNKDSLISNKKDGLEIVKYLKDKYQTAEIRNNKLEKAIYNNIVLNEYFKSKLNGKNPIIKMFEVSDERLYLEQDEVFKGIKIAVGIELNSSYVYVEGSSTLYDELIAFTGLDKEDIKNYF